jgi:hypothetical protein
MSAPTDVPHLLGKRYISRINKVPEGRQTGEPQRERFSKTCRKFRLENRVYSYDTLFAYAKLKDEAYSSSQPSEVHM